jgi:predicted metalloprotease with PDZ domain
MEYFIKRNSIPSQYIEISLNLHCARNERIGLQLPAWRPGRYELANYAQKIRNFSVSDSTNQVDWKKTSKDRWEFEANESGPYSVTYQYYCNQMDAGGCWSDDEQLYLNFSNFCFEVKGREEEVILVSIDLPEDYIVATALPPCGNFTWSADNFQHLMDSPLLAAASLTHCSYRICETEFHLWFHGKVLLDTNHLVDVFRKFTQKQIDDFGSFPASNYHFIFQLLPYKHYHGVEHAYSTVITFGPDCSLVEKSQIDELIGVSSHELYHFWNVCRIRPKELLPYDLSKEEYLEAGLVMEGVTTYFGDIYLLRSGYFTLNEYLGNLKTQIQKEFDSFGWKSQSIVESSFDLWLDGYKPGIPNKKVSIYNRGALISLCLDLMLLEHGTSLAIVMRQMWEKFGKNRIGYVLADFEQILLEGTNSEKELQGFLEKVVHGREDLLPYLEQQLSSVGISLQKETNPDRLAAEFGIKLGDAKEVINIHPDSPAYQFVMLKDIVESVEGQDEAIGEENSNKEITLKLKRCERVISVRLTPANANFFPIFRLGEHSKTEKQARWMFANTHQA